MYKFDTMKYAYISKLKYSNFHSYLFVIDTFNYLKYFNISETIYFESPTKQELQNISERYMSDSHFSSKWFNAIGVSAYGNSYYDKFYNNITDTFNITIEITKHWNKVLSNLYWSKYVNCILQTDDDTFIGNYKLPIHYWLNLTGFHTFLILPYDTVNGGILFSNFAYILYDKLNYSNSQNMMQNFLLKWWHNRLKPFGKFDQNSMFETILNYLIHNDVYFKQLYVSETLKKCADYCELIPVWNGCQQTCFRMIGFDRPTTQTILNNNIYNISVLYTPIPKCSWKYLKKYGSLENYNYDIYPFSMNMNWGDIFSITGSFYDCYTVINDTVINCLDDAKDKVQFIFDQTYLIHYRNQWKHHQWYSTVLKMKIFSQ
eukprot:305125_1